LRLKADLKYLVTSLFNKKFTDKRQSATINSIRLYKINKKECDIMADKNTAVIGFEKQIWDAACVLRGNMDASEYKGVVLGLIF
jgi:hypothetical protein